MTTWFISRHQGAIDWVKQQDITIDRFEIHLDIEQIQKGDTVIGTLPIHLAAKVCDMGAKFYALVVNSSFEQRGSELSFNELMKQGCYLQRYNVREL